MHVGLNYNVGRDYMHCCVNACCGVCFYTTGRNLSTPIHVHYILAIEKYNMQGWRTMSILVCILQATVNSSQIGVVREEFAGVFC